MTELVERFFRKKTSHRTN